MHTIKIVRGSKKGTKKTGEWKKEIGLDLKSRGVNQRIKGGNDVEARVYIARRESSEQRNIGLQTR